MADLRVRLDLSFGARSLRALMAAGMFFSAASELGSETVTLTTYYPAPSGVYAQMITTGNTYLARDTATNGGNVGIGTPSPVVTLDIGGGAGGSQTGNLHVAGNIPLDLTYQGAYIGWNSGGASGGGETDFINNRGGGPGGWSFKNIAPNIGTEASATTLVTIDNAGNLAATGGVQPGDDAAACDATKAGTLRWHSGTTLEFCNGTSWVGLTATATQAWGNYTGSRSVASTYTNGTSQPITVNFMVELVTSGGFTPMTMCTVNGVTVAYAYVLAPVLDEFTTLTFTVPPGGTYAIWSMAGAWKSHTWLELR